MDRRPRLIGRLGLAAASNPFIYDRDLAPFVRLAFPHAPTDRTELTTGQRTFLGALAPQVVALGRGAGDGRQEPAAGQDRAERVQPGLPSGRAVARNATGKHGVPGGAGWPRPKAVMPGQNIAAAAAISGAPDSNSCQVATMPLSRAAGQPGYRSLTSTGGRST